MLPFLASLAIAGAAAVILPDLYRRHRLGRQVAQLRRDAQQIGNAHQYIELGEACRAGGDWAGAAQAFETAVSKDPEALAARWGLALARFKQERYDEAETLLRTILVADRRYKFGDVSLLLGKTLASRKKPRELADHMSEHVKLWRQPEGLYLLATAQRDLGQTQAATRTLDGLLLDLEQNPRRQFATTLMWKRRARRLRGEITAGSWRRY